MRYGVLALVLWAIACGGGKPAVREAPPAEKPALVCDGRLAEVGYTATISPWGVQGVRLGCDGGAAFVEVFGDPDEGEPVMNRKPLDAAAFEAAWARLEATGWRTVECKPGICDDPEAPETTTTSFVLRAGGDEHGCTCRGYPDGPWGAIGGAIEAAASDADLEFPLGPPQGEED